jgi:rod shape-determining protein MreB
MSKAMALETQDRFATAKEMLEAIREVKIISLPSYELGQLEAKQELAVAKKAFEVELEHMRIRFNSSLDEIKKWKGKAEAAQIKIDELNEEHETKIAKLKSEYEQIVAQLAESKRILNSADNRSDLPTPSKQIKRKSHKRPEQPYWIELLLRRLSNRLFTSDLAIDLGTTNTLVFAKGRGIVVSEPSIVAINKTTNTIKAVGRDAKEMLGRTPGNIVAIRPMKDGVIANFEVVRRMLQHFIRKAHNGKTWKSPRVVIGIPSEITMIEVRAVEGSAYSANASNVYLVEKAMAAAIGAGIPITEPHGNMIVDIGGGTTDIVVISLSGIVYSRAVRVAGNEMDEAIIHYIKRKYDVLIGERTAEQIKIEIGSAFPLDDSISIEVRGRNLIEGIPKTITITDAEIREALADSVSTIVNAVRVALERIPPEFSADIIERGIVLTGGGAFLKNLDKRLSIETGIPVSLAEDPLESVVIGLGRTLPDFNLLKMVKWDNHLTT